MKLKNFPRLWATAGLILVSLAFLAGFRLEQHRQQQPAAIAQLVAEQLSLTPEQQSLFEQLHRQIKTEEKRLRHQRQALAQQMWQELLVTGDQSQVESVTREWASVSEELLLMRVTNSKQFFDALNNSQKQQFQQILRNKQFLPLPK